MTDLSRIKAEAVAEALHAVLKSWQAGHRRDSFGFAMELSDAIDAVERAALSREPGERCEGGVLFRDMMDAANGDRCPKCGATANDECKLSDRPPATVVEGGGDGVELGCHDKSSPPSNGNPESLGASPPSPSPAPTCTCDPASGSYPGDCPLHQWNRRPLASPTTGGLSAEWAANVIEFQSGRPCLSG